MKLLADLYSTKKRQKYACIPAIIVTGLTKTFTEGFRKVSAKFLINDISKKVQGAGMIRLINSIKRLNLI